MKKLNITKKKFNESKYFQTKYGKLEYVSESGKLYKTTKGKVLKFVNESSKCYVCGDVATNFIDGRPLCDDCLNDFENNNFNNWCGNDESNDDMGEEMNESTDDYEKEYQKSLEEAQGMSKEEIEAVIDDILEEDWWAYRDEYACDEEPQYRDMCDRGDFYDAQYDSLYLNNPEFTAFMDTLDKLNGKDAVEQPVEESHDDMEKEFKCHGITITRYDYESLPCPMAASKVDDKTMQKIADEIYAELSKNWSDEEIEQYLEHPVDEKDVSYDMIQDEFWAEMESVAIYNGMKYYEDLDEEDENMNESSDDIENDPAYTCPYCGGHNCEFVDADDYPEEGYFDGSTIGATYNCQGCNKDYLVIFSLSVVDKHSAKVRPLIKN